MCFFLNYDFLFYFFIVFLFLNCFLFYLIYFIFSQILYFFQRNKFKLNYFLYFLSSDFSNFFSRFVHFYSNFYYQQIKDSFFFSYYLNESVFINKMEQESTLYIWDEYDVFGDSVYSQNVKDRIMFEVESPTTQYDWFWNSWEESDRYRFSHLFEFSLAPWLESHDTRNEDVLEPGITDEYYISMETDFSIKYKKKYKVRSQSFRKFVNANYHDFGFKPTTDFDDFTYWKLFFGLTYPVHIPYHLETLYRKETWNTLRSYHSFYFDLPWDIFILRSSVEKLMALHNMDFYGVNFLHGSKGATFDSNLFSSFYDVAFKIDITFLDHPLWELQHPFIFLNSIILLIGFFEIFFFFFKFLFLILL